MAGYTCARVCVGVQNGGGVHMTRGCRYDFAEAAGFLRELDTEHGPGGCCCITHGGTVFLSEHVSDKQRTYLVLAGGAILPASVVPLKY